jgi:Putative Ig domain
LLFREDVVTTFCGETVRKLRVALLFALGILVWALVFAGCSGSSAITVALSPASGQSLSPGQTVTVIATLTNDKNNQGVSWTLTGPGSLSGNTTTSVVYTAPTSISVSATATITATSVANTSVTATESITLTAVLSIITTSLPAGTLGVPYDSFINAAGAPAPFTWTVKSGSLPPGLTFQASSTSTSAEITGTPTVLGTSNFTVQVTDSSDTSVTQALSITINRPPPLAVATASLPDGTVNVGYSQTLQASSGVQPYTWSLIGGALPFGLSLASNGAISGTPVATGTSNFTVQVKDSSSPQQTASANLSITIQQGITDNSRLHGNYAFSVRGFDPNGLFVAAGSFVADGAGNISAGVMDINDTGSAPSNPTFTGTYSIDQNGLGQLSFNVSGGSSRVFALSMMANGNANIIEFDDSTGGGTRNSGVLLRQDTSAFTGAPVAANYTFGFLGIDSSQNRFGEAGFFTSDGHGALTAGLLDSDDGGVVSSSVAFTGTSTAVSSSGRGLLSLGTSSYSFYVVNATELLVVEIDPFVQGGTNHLVSGTILQQSSVSIAAGLSVFEIGAFDPSGPTAESQVGIFNASGGTNGGTFSLTSDQNSGGTLTSPSGTGTYSIDPNTGRVSVAGSGFQNSPPVLYLVNPNQAFIIGTDVAVSSGFMTPQSSFSLGGTYAGGSLAPAERSVSNVVGIANAASNTLSLTEDISTQNGLSQIQVSDVTAPSAGNPSRILVTESGNPTEILYLVSPTEFFALDVAAGDTTARVDIFQQ